MWFKGVEADGGGGVCLCVFWVGVEVVITFGDTYSIIILKFSKKRKQTYPRVNLN